MSEPEQFWREWFKCSEGLGREVFEGYAHDESGRLLGSRVFLTECTSFLNYINRMQSGKFPCWVSVLPFQARDKPALLEKLYFDFDSKTNLELAWLEAKDFSLKIRRFYNADSLLCFSGSKGYNAYVWVQKPLTFENESKFGIKAVYEKLQEVLLKGTKYETLDHNPCFDVKRVARIPFTKHEKSGKLCVPVGITRDIVEPKNLKSYIENGLSEQLVKFCLRKLDEEEKQKQERKEHWMNKENLYSKGLNTASIRPCLSAALIRDLEEANGHQIRIAIAIEHLKAGYSPEETAQLFKSQNDYSFEESLYYVRDIITRAYMPYKCATIRELGFCLQNCPKKARHE